MDDTWSNLSRRVHARIGRPLPDRPDTADPQFLRLLSDLRRADALLAEEVINEFTGTDQRLPSEEEAEAERRRQRVRTRLFARFFRPDGLRTGRVRFNLRKTLHWVGALIAIVIIIWSAIPKSGNVSAPPVSVQATASGRVRASAPVPPSGSSRTNRPGLPMQPPVQPRAPMLPPVPVPPPPMLPDNFPPNPPPGSTGVAVPDITLPGESVMRSVIVYEASAAVGSPVVYERNAGNQLAGVLARGPGAGEDLANPPQARSPGVIVYDAVSAQASIVSPPPPATNRTPADASVPVAGRGQLLQATLVTPVAVSSVSGPSPVLAEITQGPLEGAVLLGQAVRTPGGLVGIQFAALITRNGREQPFHGVAYDAAVGRTGIAGQASTMMPGAASELVAATMQAASDYFRARAQQQQVTLTNGFLTITQGVPTFWDSLAATIVKAFTPTTSSTAGPTVVTRLERGQAITVMVI